MDKRLGTRMTDIVSGFQGIVTGRCEYLNGCVQYLVSPEVTDDGKKIEGIWFDIQQLKHVDYGIRADILAEAEADLRGVDPIAERRPGGPPSTQRRT